MLINREVSCNVTIRINGESVRLEMAEVMRLAEMGKLNELGNVMDSAYSTGNFKILINLRYSTLMGI